MTIVTGTAMDSHGLGSHARGSGPADGEETSRAMNEKMKISSREEGQKMGTAQRGIGTN